MSVIHDDEGEPRWYGFYYGKVVENADPDKRGRARIFIPGLIEPASAWALPVGGGHSSGAKGLGTYDAPPVGADVVVGFHGGDIDQPFFFGGWHGQGEQLSVVPAAAADADKVKVFESARFLIVLNGIGGAEELLVKDKVSGDSISMKPEQLKVTAGTKVTVVASEIELGDDGIAAAPLINGVVNGSSLDFFTGQTQGALGNASTRVAASKT